MVHSRLNPAVITADHHDLRDLPSGLPVSRHAQIVTLHARVVVTNAEALELALLVELVDSAQGLFVRRGAVRAVEVPHVDGAVSWKQGKRLGFNASGMTLR